MTYQQACKRASELARRTKTWRYVFLDGDGYETGTDFDCETWFLGQEPEAAFGPDGNPA